MSLTTTAQIITEGGLPSEISTAKLTGHLVKAEKRFRELLGDTLYETIEDETTETRKVHCAMAEANMALYYAIPVLGLKIGTAGGFMLSTGFAENRQTLVDAKGLQDIADRFKQIAMDLLSPYLPEVDIDEDTEADDILDVGGGLSFIALGDPLEDEY